MSKKSRHKQYVDMPQAINEVADEINRTLNERKKDKYFQSIILMYSFIENLLKWLVFVKIMWMKADKELSGKEMKELEKFCKHLRFYDALEAGLMIDLVDFNLYKRINDVRKERNDVLHQFWIYRHRDNLSVLRKKLEKLARVSNTLVGIFDDLTQEIGIEEVYEILLWGDG
ncbi:hypothetical protein CEE36_09135 [candidate division TA06 bacterium B3_TA06]|uniref:RiboL-PSP-HEPN domain-containing protein n=1 Tax=candidate division TA06 bacterium B3_TA06 TaxID=2012487 RepID=A0A532V1P3_UNCT6|nr:MAG: hypothetical protein CEE36_09135 [candidate division TA06 bacterium B3_TA06]